MTRCHEDREKISEVNEMLPYVFSTTPVGQTIRRLRKERGLTQEELAEQLGVTAQAVSKWENETGMPDISQIVPLAGVFGVSTDVIFGLDTTTAGEDVAKILRDAEADKVGGGAASYIKAYDRISEGLRKYPCDQRLLMNGFTLGMSLCMPDSGFYSAERAEEIAARSVRWAGLIVSYSRNIDDIMFARMGLIQFWCSKGQYDRAVSEAEKFPVRSDFTRGMALAYIDGSRGNHEAVIKELSTNIDYCLQEFEDSAAQLGKAYIAVGRSREAVVLFERYFVAMKVIFDGERPRPYHDFDSGDCYLLLAKAYLTLREKAKAMKCLRDSVEYYVGMFDRADDDPVDLRSGSPFVSESSISLRLDREVARRRLERKIDSDLIAELHDEPGFDEIRGMVGKL